MTSAVEVAYPGINIRKDSGGVYFNMDTNKRLDVELIRASEGAAKELNRAKEDEGRNLAVGIGERRTLAETSAKLDALVLYLQKTGIIT